MQIKKRVINFLGFLFSFFLFLGFVPKQKNKVIDNFRLYSTSGKWIELNEYRNCKGVIVVFTCNHCPFAKLYPGRLNELNKIYSAKGVPLIAISSTDSMLYEEDGYLQMAIKSKVEQFNFEYLTDATQVVAKQFNAQKRLMLLCFGGKRIDGLLNILAL